MSGTNIFDDRSSKLSYDDTWKLVHNYLGHTSFVLEKVSLEPIELRGGNLGDYYKVSVVVKLHLQKQEIYLFAKFLPSLNEATMSMVKKGPSQKEDFFYSVLIEEFRSVGLGAYLDFYPKCYLSKVNDVLILEDLTLADYQLSKSQTFYTYEMLKVSVRQLAKLHASTLVYEERKSAEAGWLIRLDQRFDVYLREIVFQMEEDNEAKQMCLVGINSVVDYLIYRFPEVIRDMTMEEFARKTKEAYEYFWLKVKKSEKYRNAFCHGDIWSSNILFSYNHDGQPTDCKLVDFQLTRYCPPAQDLLAHIYVTTRKITRTLYMESLLDEYYEDMSRIIHSFSLDIEKILPKKDFLDSCRYMKSQAICQALLYVPINTITDRQELFTNPDLFEATIMTSRNEFIERMIKKYESYGENLKELVEDLYELCEKNEHRYL
ncbi:uncharacterized protein LOC143202436 [Rhynchophorus ferrugineus]|uniref:uncharacterized protein LOC143202436 n=1 Tax=Rhynchophorus ferrugineus TaxID=354439 RepID=UPI003FCD7D6B